jgi:outer membrane biosynthesis protein TonB
MFESIADTTWQSGRRGSMLASIALHGLVVSLAAAFTYVKGMLPRPVDVTLPATATGHKTRLPRVLPKPVALKVPPRTILQPRAIPEMAPRLLTAGMTRPAPTGACSPLGARPRPTAPDTGMSGTVLVEYVVQGDGRVKSIVLKNQAAPMLFEAVQTWLKSCPWTPSMSAGKPVPVRMTKPFIFKPL